VTEGVRTCPACRLAVAADARFCPNCGNRLDAEHTDLDHGEPAPRLFGVLSPTPAFVLACILAAGSLVALLAQSWILAVLFLAAAAALFVLFYGAAKRDPSGPLARGTLDGVSRISGWTRVVQGSAGAWGSAGRRVFDLRRQVARLRDERHEVQLALGEAAYREDAATIASLRTRMAEIDDAIASSESARADALASARSRVEDERLAVHETQHLPPDDADGHPGSQA